MNTPAPRVTADRTTATANLERLHKEAIAKALSALLHDAWLSGFVITVDLEPLLPLAQGNYRMVGSVRGALR